MWLGLGTALLAASLLPTARIPPYFDDFVNSQQWFDKFHGSLGTALATGWNADGQANRFNPVGREFALVYHFLAYDLTSRFGASLATYYRVGAFVLIWLTVLAAAYAFTRAVRFMASENDLALPKAFAALSTVFAIILQLHLWSYDPTTTITEIGYGAAALCFVLLGLAFSAARPEVSVTRAVWPVGVVSLLGVLFYETFATAIVAVAIVYGVLLWRARRDGTGLRKPLWLLAVGVALPAVVFVAGHLYVAHAPNLGTYSGTDIVLSSAGLRPFAVLALSAIPGTSWSQTNALVGGARLSVGPLVTAVTIFVLTMVVAWRLLGRRAAALTLTRHGWWVVAVYGVHWGLALAMTSFTQKYIDEITQLGSTYLVNASGVLVVASALTALVLAVPASARSTSYGRLATLVLLALVGAFVLGQQTMNWSAAAALRDGLAVNRDLGAAAVGLTGDEAARCAAERAWWTANAQYLDDNPAGVLAAVRWNYQFRFGTPFCSTDLGEPAGAEP